MYPCTEKMQQSPLILKCYRSLLCSYMSMCTERLRFEWQWPALLKCYTGVHGVSVCRKHAVQMAVACVTEVLLEIYRSE